MSEGALHFYPGQGGVRLAYRDIGSGRPLVLLHGLSTDGRMWIRPGHAKRFGAAGFRTIIPDFRGHGESDKPHDPAAYPPDVLTDDVLALVAHLDLGDYDLAGYSLGARIAARALVRGATPGRAVVAGQGLREFLGTVGRAGTQLRRIFAGAGTGSGTDPGPDGPAPAPDSREVRAAEHLRARGADPVALLHVLDSLVSTSAEAIGQIQVRTLVLIGVDDERAESTDELTATLPHGTLVRIPGNHMTAASSPELATAIVDFLT